MSSVLARKKRMGDTTPAVPTQTQVPPKPSGLTLPQVINVIDNRLITLETFMKESKQPASSVSFEDSGLTNDFMNEMQSRYEILAQEIGELKDIVLKLQTYTMDVNKALLEERIHILSDLGETGTNKDESTMLEFSDV